jgi:hypothetical protein
MMSTKAQAILKDIQAFPPTLQWAAGADLGALEREFDEAVPAPNDLTVQEINVLETFSK